MWKYITGYEGLYQVSDQGEIKSCERFRFTKYLSNGERSGYIQKERIKALKICKSTGGLKYLQVTLCKDGVSKLYLVHRLVAEMYIDNPMNKPYVNHIDGNTLNNNVDNLEWTTNRENQLHAIHELHHDNYKAVVAYCKKTMEYAMEFQSISDAAKWLIENGRTKDQTCLTGIIKCCKGKIPSFHGYVWRYKIERGDE